MTRFGIAAGCAAVVLVAAAFATNAATTPTTPTVAASRSSDGEQLFRRKGCAMCHTGPGSTAVIDVAPSLADAPSWAGERKPGVAARDYLAESMLAPSTFISPAFRGAAGPMTAMPELALSPEEVDALIDYLLHP